MSNYRRLYLPNHMYFFTLVAASRKAIFNNEKNISILRQSIARVKQKYPFYLDAIVILPDHLHMLMRMPMRDSNYSVRIRLIKYYVTQQLKTKPVWQHRFWEHCIRDELDLRNHMNYIHYNPVKHGYVASPREWKASSFIKWVNKGYYNIDWGAIEPNYLPDVPE